MIVICGVWHMLYLMFITSILSLFLMTIVVWHKSIFWAQKMKYFLLLNFFHAYVQTQFTSQIKVLRCDNERGYNLIYSKTSYKQMTFYLKCHVLLLPQQNGVGERKNCHLLDLAHTLMLESFKSSQFWCEALSTVVHLVNCLSSSH